MGTFRSQHNVCSCCGFYKQLRLLTPEKWHLLKNLLQRQVLEQGLELPGRTGSAFLTSRGLFMGGVPRWTPPHSDFIVHLLLKYIWKCPTSDNL